MNVNLSNQAIKSKLELEEIPNESDVKGHTFFDQSKYQTTLKEAKSGKAPIVCVEEIRVQG